MNSWDNKDNVVGNNVVAAIRTENVEEHPNNVVFLKKYSDYSDKMEANKLLPHTAHDLSIDLINRKQLLFDPVYD